MSRYGRWRGWQIEAGEFPFIEILFAVPLSEAEEAERIQ